MEDMCIHVEAMNRGQTGLIFCKSVKNFMQAENKLKECGCEKYPDSKSSFKCADYPHYMKAYEVLNKVV
jgi:hypothetical protein